MYKFTYRNNRKDVWQMSMYYTYGSIIGVCNIIFTVAMIVMGVSLWKDMNVVFRILDIIGIMLFTVIQPVAVWSKSAKKAKLMDYDTELTFHEKGMHIKVNDQDADLGWEHIRKIANKPTMVIIYSDKNHGYVIPNRAMKNERKEFIEFVNRKINK